MTRHPILRQALAGLVVASLAASSAVARDCTGPKGKQTCFDVAKPRLSGCSGKACIGVGSSGGSGSNSLPATGEALQSKAIADSPAQRSSMVAAPTGAAPTVAAPAMQIGH